MISNGYRTHPAELALRADGQLERRGPGRRHHHRGRSVDVAGQSRPVVGHPPGGRRRRAGSHRRRRRRWSGGFWWLYVPLRFDDFQIIVMAQEKADGYRTLNDAKRVWADGRVEQLGWPMYDITYRSGTRHPEHATLHLTDMSGKPVTLEIDTLGFVPLQLGPGYGDAEWAHGQWKGESWADAVRVDLTDPAVVPRIPFGNIDHVGHAYVRRRRRLGAVRARQHRRPRADRLRRPDVRRAVSVVVRSRVADGVELVELDDPGRYNALTTAMVAELRDTFADLRDDRDVRAVVVAGRGQGLLRRRQHDAATTSRQPKRRTAVRSAPSTSSRTTWPQLMLAIHELPQPVIAAVHGAAVGGGLADRAAVRHPRRQRRRVVRRAVHPRRALRVRRRQQLLAPARRRTDHRRRAHAHRPPVLRRRGAALRDAQPRRRPRRAGRQPRSSSRSWSPPTASTACT